MYCSTNITQSHSCLYYRPWLEIIFAATIFQHCLLTDSTRASHWVTGVFFHSYVFTWLLCSCSCVVSIFFIALNIPSFFVPAAPAAFNNLTPNASRLNLNSSMQPSSASVPSIKLLGLEMLLHYFLGPDVVSTATKSKLVLTLGEWSTLTILEMINVVAAATLCYKYFWFGSRAFEVSAVECCFFL